MMEDILVPIFGMLTSFGSIFGILYVFLTTRHRERMNLIEKGADASLFKSESNSLTVLKWGMFFLGIGLGILMGNLVAYKLGMDPEVAFPSMIILFGGLGLIIYYLIARKMSKKE